VGTSTRLRLHLPQTHPNLPASSHTLKSGSDENFATLNDQVHRLLDAEMYEIGVRGDTRMQRWIERDLREILERSAGGWTLTLRDVVIEFKVHDSTRFEVRRSDGDGSLTWP